MKMGIGFWLGGLIILFGVSIVVDTVFNIHIPVFRTGIALFLIYLGVKVLLGAWTPARSMRHDERAAVFMDSLFAPATAHGPLKYDIIFGRGVVDLTKLQPQGDVDVEVNTVFGSALVKIDPGVPLEIEASAAFGAARMPDQTLATFGTTRYQPLGQDLRPRLHVKLNVVFGEIRVQERSASVDRALPSSDVPVHASR